MIAKSFKVKKTGFTLVELLIVIIIFGILLAAFVPLSLRSFRSLQLVDASRNIVAVMKYIQNKAILERRTYRLDFDITDSLYAVSLETPGGLEKFEEVKTSLFARKKLGPNLKIGSLVVEKENFPNKEEEYSVYFYPDGSIDESVLVLRNVWDEKITIETSISGKISVGEE